MENNDKRKKIILSVIGILVLVVGIVGITYAYFIARGQSENIVVTSKNLKLVFDDSTPVINAADIEPIEEDEILIKATKKTFRISKESASGKDLYVRLDMTDLVVSDNFKDFDLKWALYKGDKKVSAGTFASLSNDISSINMATNILINSTTPIEYNLYIWINETGLDQERLMDGTLSGKITAIGEINPNPNTLAMKILGKNKSNVIEGNYNFASDYTYNETKTNDSENNYYHVKTYDYNFNEGLYSASDSDGTTYYYRGNVNNNYVKFEGKTWRISRINGDGSIRIVHDYINVNVNEADFISADYMTMSMKKSIDDFASSFVNNDNIVESIFCNDKTNDSSSRIENKNPTFVCQESNRLNLKVGTLSAEEAMLSGVVPGAYVDGYDLRWPFSNAYEGIMFITKGVGTNSLYLTTQMVNVLNSEDYATSSFTEKKAFPVINLSSNVFPTTGNGTYSEPYIIK